MGIGLSPWEPWMGTLGTWVQCDLEAGQKIWEWGWGVFLLKSISQLKKARLSRTLWNCSPISRHCGILYKGQSMRGQKGVVGMEVISGCAEWRGGAGPGQELMHVGDTGLWHWGCRADPTVTSGPAGIFWNQEVCTKSKRGRRGLVRQSDRCQPDLIFSTWKSRPITCLQSASGFSAENCWTNIKYLSNLFCNS